MPEFTSQGHICIFKTTLWYQDVYHAGGISLDKTKYDIYSHFESNQAATLPRKPGQKLCVQSFKTAGIIQQTAFGSTELPGYERHCASKTSYFFLFWRLISTEEKQDNEANTTVSSEPKA